MSFLEFIERPSYMSVILSVYVGCVLGIILLLYICRLDCIQTPGPWCHSERSLQVCLWQCYNSCWPILLCLFVITLHTFSCTLDFHWNMEYDI